MYVFKDFAICFVISPLKVYSQLPWLHFLIPQGLENKSYLQQDSGMIHRAPFHARAGQRGLQTSKILQIPLSQSTLEQLSGFLHLYLLLGLTGHFMPEQLCSAEYFFFWIHWNCSYLSKSWQLLKFLVVLWGALCLCRTKGFLSWNHHLNHDEWAK